MLKVMESLRAVYDLMYGAEVFLSVNEQDELEKHLLRLGQNYVRLAVMASEAGEQAWRVTPISDSMLSTTRANFAIFS